MDDLNEHTEKKIDKQIDFYKILALFLGVSFDFKQLSKLYFKQLSKLFFITNKPKVVQTQTQILTELYDTGDMP